MFYVIATQNGRRTWMLAGPYRHFQDAQNAVEPATYSRMAQTLMWKYDVKISTCTVHSGDDRLTLLGPI